MNETTTPETEVGTSGLSEEGAVQELLGKWAKAEQPPEEETTEEPAPEQAEQADAPEPEEAEAEPEAEADTEIDIAGEKIKLPAALRDVAKRIEAKAKEVEAGATRKFQEAADARKAIDAERAAISQLRAVAESQADLLADHKMVTRRLSQLEQIDINSVDTDTLTRLNAEYNQLQAARGRIEQTYKTNVAQLEEKQTEALRARQEHAEKVVSQKIKGWGPEKAKSLAEYAIARGAPAEALNGITEPWMVEILEDAAYGRQMREHKSTLDKRVVQAQPTLKPGASTTQPKAAVKAQDAMTRLAKTGTTADAAMALLARSQVRKK
jgi:hypothetical protein